MAILVLLGALLFGSPDSASAKGPISAVISGPGIERPMELLDAAGPEQMQRLMEQTGLWYVTGDQPRPIAEPTGDLGPAYTLTWINGGPPDKSEAERTMVQLIYLEAEQGPIIHTPPQPALDNWGAGVIGWFAASDSLPETLATYGVPVHRPWSLGDLGQSVLSPDGWRYGAVIVGLVLGLTVMWIARPQARPHRRRARPG